MRLAAFVIRGSDSLERELAGRHAKVSERDFTAQLLTTGAEKFQNSRPSL